MPKTKREAVPRKMVRIPTPLVREIDIIVEECGLYINRQQFIESALREKVEKFLFVGEATSLRPELRIKARSQEADDDLLVRVKETILAHTIIWWIKGRTTPAHHLDLKQLEQIVRRYIKKRGGREGRKITEKRLDELTDDILKFHNELLEGLSLMSRH